MKFRIRLDQNEEKAAFSSAIGTIAVQGKWKFAALLALFLAAASFVLPGASAKAEMIKMMLAGAFPGENIAELGKHEVAKSIGERLYWGRLVAAVNPRLTKYEINEIGRAVLKYSGEYGLSPEIIVAIIKVESSGRVKAVSPHGAQGLMQVMPFWKDELGIEGTLFNIDNNIRAGTHILAEYIKAHGFEEGVARYYRGTMPVSAQGYLAKVEKAMRI